MCESESASELFTFLHRRPLHPRRVTTRQTPRKVAKSHPERRRSERDTRDVSIGRGRCVREARFGANTERKGVVGDEVIRSARETRGEAR